MPSPSRSLRSRPQFNRVQASRKFSPRRSSILEQAIAYWRADSYKESTNQLNELTGSGVSGATLGSSSTPNNSASPTRLVYEGSKYVYLPGISTSYISTPDTSLVSVTGDIDIRVRARIESIAASRCFVAKYTVTNNRSFAFFQNSNGTLRFDFTIDGTNAAVAASSVVNPIPVGTLSWFRTTRSSSTGEVLFYTSTTNTSDINSVVWTQLGASVSTTSGSIFDSSVPLNIGEGDPTGQFPFLGGIYYAEVRSGIGGSVVARFDADLCGQTGYTDNLNSNNTVWTINRGTTGKKGVLVERTTLLFGTDDYMEVIHNNLLNPDLGSFTALVLYRVWSDTGDFRDLMSKYSGGVAPFWVVEIRASTDGYNVINDGVTNIQGASPSVSQGTAKFTGFILNRTDQTFYRITNSQYSAVLSTASLGALNPSGSIRFGREANSANYANFEFFAAVIFRKALTVDEVEQLTKEFL